MRKNLPMPLLVAFLFAMLPPVLQAQQLPEPKPLRFDVTPFFGYRTSESFPVEPHVTGTNPRVVLDAAPTYGISFGARLTGREEDLIEVRWARQDSYLHSEEITPQIPRGHILLDQFHGDFSHEPYIEEWPSWVKPYVLGSIGATHVSVTSGMGFTRFSFGLGGGIRFYASRHLGFKIQGEWLATLAAPQIAVVCGGGCIVHVGGAAASQGEAFFGPFIRF
ncbi:MAG TPA: hypothetical protein VMS18_18060 [Candidatus Binatia bacterium]|nr:hypothetical protein [Candidatus Binatia bacterium]